MITWWYYEVQSRSLYVLGANFGLYNTEIYRDKFAEIFDNMEDVGFQANYIDIGELAEIDMQYLQKNMDEQNLQDMDDLRKQAECHFDGLDKILKPI